MSLLALSALATQLTSGHQAQSFALGGVVATKLLPPCCCSARSPVRWPTSSTVRRVMVVCDLPALGLFVSIPLVGRLCVAARRHVVDRDVRSVLDPGQRRRGAQPAPKDPTRWKRRPARPGHDLRRLGDHGVGLFALLSPRRRDPGASALDTRVRRRAPLRRAYLVIALTVLLRIPEISGALGARRAPRLGCSR
jgi:dTMP kinase